MNYQRQKLFILSLVFVFCFLSACDEKSDPVSADYQSFDTPFGTATQVDDYPLYTMTYTADYKFEEYLENGAIPFSSNNHTNAGNYCCTCFSALGENNRLLGRNYDWPESSTYFTVFTNPGSGYSSLSTVDVSFFDYNHSESPDFSGNHNTIRELPYYPFDGMNEMGVAIGMNAVPRARSPHDPAKVTIGELQLIRLVLDYASSTNEAITLVQQYNIRMEDPPIHYLIADSSGHSVILEFVDGEMEIMENTAPWQVTTNFVITGMNSPLEAPCWRFRTAYEMLSTNQGNLSESAAISLLQNVSVTTTRWSVVFDMKSGQISIAMGRKYQNLHTVSVYE